DRDGDLPDRAADGRPHRGGGSGRPLPHRHLGPLSHQPRHEPQPRHPGHRDGRGRGTGCPGRRVCQPHPLYGGSGGLQHVAGGRNDRPGESARAELLAAGVPEKMLDEEQLAMVYSDHSETSRLMVAGEELGADVILLGTQADSQDGRYRMGSSADALLHCSPLPLMLVPRNLNFSKAGPTRVNCAYVDTEQSQQALRHASDLARRWGVPLRLVAFSPAGVSLDPTQVAFGDAVAAAGAGSAGVGGSGAGGAGSSSAAAPLAEAWQVQAKELL